MRGFLRGEPTLGVGLAFDPWRLFDQALSDLASRDFANGGAANRARFPKLNLWTNAEGAVVTAIVPGIQPADIDVSVQGQTLTLRVKRAALEIGEGATLHRRERQAGSFARAVDLPFPVDAAKVTAKHTNGVLRVDLPRLEADKPRRITVTG